MSADSPIIVALDYPSRDDAMAFVDRIRPELAKLKVGKEMFTRLGPDFVRELVDRDFDVFLDLKYHDIPNTVARACEAGAELGVWMMNVHASGGLAMMKAAREAVAGAERRPLLIAVTILTSLGDEDVAQIGYQGSARDSVLRLAGLAEEAGLDGVVCSPMEVEALRAERGSDFALVTPGIRPADAATGDQKRVMTPAMAMQAGSSHLVIGRPITQAEDPVARLESILAELG